MEYGPDGTWREMFVKGVNLGATSPGYYPGEFPDRRGLPKVVPADSGDGANVIRVYTVHEPIFTRHWSIITVAGSSRYILYRVYGRRKKS